MLIIKNVTHISDNGCDPSAVGVAPCGPDDCGSSNCGPDYGDCLPD